MGQRWLLCLVFGMAIVLCACGIQETVKPATLRVEPVDLFAGDAKKFQPFLGEMSGSVKLKYDGEKKVLRATAEIWENGRKTKELGSIGSSILNTDENSKKFEGEFIVSLKNQQSDAQSGSEARTSYTATVSFYQYDGSSSTVTFQVDAPTKHTSKMEVRLDKPLEAAETEQVAVWGMQATDENVMRTIDFTPESLKNAKWVIVIKVGLADEYK
jgi:hypothetical protein